MPILIFLYHSHQYVVNVDDFFLRYLQRGHMVVELHQAIGTDYHTLAVGKVLLMK